MVIADTGFWLALANRRDRHHARAVERVEAFGEPLVTTWPVVTETCHLLLARLGVASYVRFLESYAAGAFEIFELGIGDRARLCELVSKYASQPMDLADASLVLLAEHLGHGRILSTDRRDFTTYRFDGNRPFEMLMFS